MKITFTKAQMLERRRLVGGLEPLRTDCSVSEADGIDIDRILEIELRNWYLDLLDNGPLSMLALTDMASASSITSGSGTFAGATIVKPPESCRRAVSIFLQGWAEPATVLPQEEAGRCFTLQRNPYTSASKARPMAVRLSDGNIATWPAAGTLISLLAAADTGPESYVFDESALATLPKDF